MKFMHLIHSLAHFPVQTSACNRIGFTHSPRSRRKERIEKCCVLEGWVWGVRSGFVVSTNVIPHSMAFEFGWIIFNLHLIWSVRHESDRINRKCHAEQRMLFTIGYSEDKNGRGSECTAHRQRRDWDSIKIHLSIWRSPRSLSLSHTLIHSFVLYCLVSVRFALEIEFGTADLSN